MSDRRFYAGPGAPLVTADEARRDELRDRQAEILAELQPILRRLERAGLEQHMHGLSTYESPSWWHSHEFTERHDHADASDIQRAIAAGEWSEEDDARDAARSQGEAPSTFGDHWRQAMGPDDSGRIQGEAP